MIALAALALVVSDIACTQHGSRPGSHPGKYAEKGAVRVECVAVLDTQAPAGATCTWAFGDWSSIGEYCGDRQTLQVEHSYRPRPRPYPVTFTVYGPGGTAIAEGEAAAQIGPSAKPHTVKAPRAPAAGLTLQAFPRMGLHPLGQPFHTEVVLSFRGEEEPEELYCPKVSWELNGDFQGAHEADCPPYEAGTDYPRRWTREFWLGPGEHLVTVTISRGGRPLRTLSVTVQVLGE